MSPETQSAVSSRLLSQLPPELLVKIAENLPIKTRKKLSLTNSSWRNYLAPSLFGTIKFSNCSEDEEVIAGVISKYGRHTRRLHFECHLKPNVSPPRDEPRPSHAGSESDIIGNDLSHTAVKVLKGDLLPKIKSFEVEFFAEKDFEGAGWDTYDGSALLCRIAAEPEGSLAEVQEKEQYFRWRATMARVWSLVAMNPTIDSLVISSLPPKMTSAWSAKNWIAFLNRLEKLSIGLWGCEWWDVHDIFPISYHSHCSHGYHDFLASLGDPLCGAAYNLKQLSIVADVGNPYGRGGPSDINSYPFLPLRDTHMPMLEELTLENCIVDGRLTCFIEAHATILRKLSLIDCMATWEMSWASLFRCIANCSPVLSELVITDEIIPLTAQEDYSNYDPPEDEPARVQQIRRELKQDSRRRLFAYIVFDTYGELYNDSEANVFHYLQNEDQKAYDRVVKIVQRNAWRRKYADQSFKMKLPFLLD